MIRLVPAALAILGLLGLLHPLVGGELVFRDQELPTRLTVGYAVRLLDMNADGRLDIAIVDSDRLLWLENPAWQEHVILQGQTPRDNVCFAPYDIDGDGQLDFALGAAWQPGRPDATRTGGSIHWLRGRPDPGPWTLHAIGSYPTTHRMQFADLDGDGRAELIVSPLQGEGTSRPDYAERGTPLLVYPIPGDPVHGPWQRQVICDDVHVTHNFQVVDVDGDRQLDILLVSFEGVHWLTRQKDGTWQRTRIGEGNQQTRPNRGASEVKLGRRGDGSLFIATIEPWHGHQVVVYTPPAVPRPARGDWLWRRQVLDEELKWGHAVLTANLDDDADDELIIGVRDNLSETVRCGVRVYDPAEGQWVRQLVDPGSVAVEDLAAGDLNGDGRIDLVAVGRATHNVKIYWNQTPRAAAGGRRRPGGCSPATQAGLDGTSELCRPGCLPPGFPRGTAGKPPSLKSPRAVLLLRRLCLSAVGRRSAARPGVVLPGRSARLGTRVEKVRSNPPARVRQWCACSTTVRSVRSSTRI